MCIVESSVLSRPTQGDLNSSLARDRVGFNNSHQSKIGARYSKFSSKLQISYKIWHISLKIKSFSETAKNKKKKKTQKKKLTNRLNCPLSL